MRKVRIFDDEAACNDSESDESDEDGSEGSLADFIVARVADKSAAPVVKRKRGRPPKNTVSTIKKNKKARGDDDSNDDDDYTPSTANKSALPVAAKRSRGRPRKNIDVDSLDKEKSSSIGLKQNDSNAVAPKGPGHPSFPINDFSLTITKSNGDVGRDAFESVALFIKEHCIKGGVATEVGKRKFQYHLQGILRLHWPVTLPYLSKLQKCIRDLLPLKGTGYKVTCNPFKRGQSFSAMTGYITKDEGNLFISSMNKACFTNFAFRVDYFFRRASAL